MTPAYDRALQIVDKLKANRIPATVDPRSATPPCVLVTPPNGTLDISCGFTAEWSLIALAPGAGNADSFKALDGLRHSVCSLFPVDRFDLISYSLSPDNPPFPAYRIQMKEGV